MTVLWKPIWTTDSTPENQLELEESDLKNDLNY